MQQWSSFIETQKCLMYYILLNLGPCGHGLFCVDLTWSLENPWPYLVGVENPTTFNRSEVLPLGTFKPSFSCCFLWPCAVIHQESHKHCQTKMKSNQQWSLSLYIVRSRHNNNNTYQNCCKYVWCSIVSMQNSKCLTEYIDTSLPIQLSRRSSVC